MKVVARARIVEAGALRKPGDVFEVSKERLKSLGDVVEVAPEVQENLEPDDDRVEGSNPGERGVPEPGNKLAPKKLSTFDRVKNMFGFKRGKVDVDSSNLSEITREDLEDLNKDQINDLFARVDNLDLKSSMKKGEMIDAALTWIEFVFPKKEERSGENG